MRPALLAMLALVACHSKQDKPAEARRDEAKPPAMTNDAPGVDQARSCDARAERLRKRLLALASTLPGQLPILLPDGLTLPAAAAGKAIDEPSVVVMFTRDDQVGAGGNIVSLAEGARLIDEAYARPETEAMYMDRGPKRPWPLYVWADKDAKVASLAKLFASDPEMFHNFKLRLLVEGAPPAPEPLVEKPAVKQVVEAMPRKTDEEAEIYRAQHFRAAGDPCSTLPMAYAKSSIESGPANELAVIAERLTAAMVECKCNLSNPDVWEWGLLSMFGAFHPRPTWIEMPALAKTDKRTVAELVK
jgi:hypothetical protein